MPDQSWGHVPSWVPGVQGLGPVLFLRALQPGKHRPTMAVSVISANVDSLRLKQGDAVQQAPRCPAGSGCRRGSRGQGGHEWTVRRGEAWLALARLQINSSPAASQPRGERENSFHTVFADFFFHSAASKLIPNRLSDCLDFRREVARLGLVFLLVTFSPSFLARV